MLNHCSFEYSPSSQQQQKYRCQHDTFFRHYSNFRFYAYSCSIRRFSIFRISSVWFARLLSLRGMVRSVAFSLPSSSASSVSFTFFCSLIEAVYWIRAQLR